MPDAYSTLMEQLQHAVERLGEVAERRSRGIVAAGAGALRAKLAEERFNVVVVGEFKRGKTTFVNALLGAEILPTAVVPLTSIVTALVWGREIRAEVRLPGRPGRGRRPPRARRLHHRAREPREPPRRRSVPLMVDKHCGRLRWDFVQRLERSRIALERQLDERLDASEESLRLGLRRASKEQARGRREMASTQAEAAEARAALDALDETMGELAGRARDLARAMPKEDPVRA